MSKRMFGIGALGLTLGFVAVGCGGGGGGRARVTNTLVSNVVDDVSAGDCQPIEGPYSVPGGTTMHYDVVDQPVGVGFDNYEIAVIDDSLGCALPPAAGAYGYQNGVTDPVATFNVPTGNYDLVVFCNNLVDPCQMNVVWTATY